ncbi:hypothetical protein HJC23_009398 [Cyclotella cryptica]|uniref:RRM domain-containing protein n=1 Tax=Cyclotella cryptica TaxID=29204 RepID=A0ABD3PX46_9STRA|eukprot:CCRYP_010603-RA/>CCRYP_010603-RA protein AED:0.02 eAED:0.01 QI:0/-1/0/1/-1/1/1/0/588
MTSSSTATTQPSANHDNSYAPISSLAITLQTPFLYQNRTTGQPSSTPLTTRQLCRILCPVSSVSAIISPQTLLLGFDAETNTYYPEGWRPASSIPVLKEACSNWYYEGTGGVQGPVSTRILAQLLFREEIDLCTRVFGDNGGNQHDGEWKSIQDLPPLQLAMEALTESEMPTSWPADTPAPADRNANMTFDDTKTATDENDEDATKQKQIADELEAFLSSTDHLAQHAARGDDDEDEHDEEYESDGGTIYVKDYRTGNWVHEALAPKRERKQTTTNESASLMGKTPADAATETKKRKRNKPKFSAKNAKCWIYVTGLPTDTSEEEVAAYFSKCGVIDLDPETQKPKVKLYRHKANEEEGRTLKGDASICYARPESVDLALQILDENLFRDGATLSVQRAKFEQHGSAFEEGNKTKNGRRIISEAKRKVARLAALQAVGWDEGENGRIAGGLKGLRIIVLRNMFDPADLLEDPNDEKLGALEKTVHTECEEMGTVEKITIFSKHPAGVVIVKFAQPNAASDAVNRFNGQIRDDGKRKVEASYWDGVTDYTVVDEEKEAKEAEKRLDEFGDWLENQELPEEFQLRVAEEE